tara:strand:- start:1755 stop:2219 length:465 start_codon:yes stop_codon:yes gene_type:complete
MNQFTSSDLDRILQASRSYSVGLDNIFHRLEARALADHEKTSYPPYNLIKETDHRWVIEVALAGFKQEEFEVATETNVLSIRTVAEKNDDDRGYLHKGVAKRSFARTFTLSDDVKIGDVNYEDGLLTIVLNKVVPDSHKRKVYNIGCGCKPDSN